MAKKLRTIQEVKEYLGDKDFKKFTSPNGMYYSDRNKKALPDATIISMVNDGIKMFGYDAFTSNKNTPKQKEAKPKTARLATKTTKWLDAQVINGYVSKSIANNIKTNLIKESPAKLKQLEKLIVSADISNNNKKTINELARKYGLAEKMRGQ